MNAIGNSTMPRFLYSLILTLALPVILLRLLLRSVKAPAYRRRLAERFALSLPSIASDDRPLIWIHAVSVGEVAAAEPLIQELLSADQTPRFLITTMTPTGSERAARLLGENVSHCYMPYDLPFLLQPLINRIRPSVLVLMETELWPNLIHCCQRSGVKIMLANARLSERSARGYQRIAGMTRNMLQAVDVIAAQAEADGQRFAGLGADANRISVTGSLKFHIAVRGNNAADTLFADIKASGRPVFAAASTREGEEEKLLPAISAIHKAIADALVIIVPRHPERFNDVASLLNRKQISFRRRSENPQLDASVQVLLGDSMGELQDYLACAQLAFIGGSLVDTGCQNVLEPAALGIPILVGPSQYNFATICRQLETAGALITVDDAEQLAEEAIGLLQQEPRRQAMARAGLDVIASNQQALPAQAGLIRRLLLAD